MFIATTLQFHNAFPLNTLPSKPIKENKILKSNPYISQHNTILSMAQAQNFETAKSILIFGVYHKVFSDSETVEAAEQLSDEEHCSNTTASDGNTNNLELANDLFGGVCGQEEITSRKIEEIFGKDEDVQRLRPERKRRYRSIADIYSETETVVNVRNGKKKIKHEVRF